MRKSIWKETETLMGEFFYQAVKLPLAVVFCPIWIPFFMVTYWRRKKGSAGGEES